MIGPVVKIDPADLPRLPNIHYLGPKRYEELPRIHGRVGPGAAAVCAQRSDALHQPDENAGVSGGRQAGRLDLDSRRRHPYADRDLVRIADTVDDFVDACANALREVPEPRRVRADVFLRGTSWNRTWAKTAALLDAVTRQPSSPAVGATAASSPRLGA